MPVKVMLPDSDGYAICDTPAEALELLKLSRVSKNGTGEPKSDQHHTDEPSEEERAVAVFGEIKDNARALLIKLTSYKHWIRTDKFQEETGFQMNTYGGTIGSVTKAAKKHGFRNLSPFVISDSKMDGRVRYNFLQAGPMLLRYGDRLKS